MAETAGSLRTAILRRIRDPNGTAHAAADVLTLLTAAQRLVNIKTRALVSTSTPTRVFQRPVVSLSSSLGNYFGVESVRLGGRELPHIDWQTLVHHDPFWFRDIGNTPQVWSMIGHTLVLIWPRPVTTTATDVTITKTTTTTVLTADSDITELPDQHMPAILDIVEQCLLARQRLFASLKHVSEKQKTRIDGGRAT